MEHLVQKLVLMSSVHISIGGGRVGGIGGKIEEIFADYPAILSEILQNNQQ